MCQGMGHEWVFAVEGRRRKSEYWIKSWDACDMKKKDVVRVEKGKTPKERVLMCEKREKKGEGVDLAR